MQEYPLVGVFAYGDSLVRTIKDEESGEFCFVAKDVCGCLGLENSREACSTLDEDELTSVKLTSGGQTREMTAVTEAGLYNLIFKSRKEEAKPFKRWVTHEVLPSIRKTGSYGVNKDHESRLSAIETAVENLTNVLSEMASAVSHIAEGINGLAGAVKEALSSKETPSVGVFAANGVTVKPNLWTSKVVKENLAHRDAFVNDVIRLLSEVPRANQGSILQAIGSPASDTTKTRWLKGGIGVYWAVDVVPPMTYMYRLG